MRTALICAICFFCGAALLAPIGQVKKIPNFDTGPFALSKDRMWTAGPFTNEQEFQIEPEPPSAPSIVVTGWSNRQWYLERLDDQGIWQLVIDARNQVPPRPGLILRPGHYRWGGSNAMLFGYTAPFSTSRYGGSDVYLPKDRIWQVHPGTGDDRTWTVPTGETWILTWAQADLQKWDGSQWTQYNLSQLGTDVSLDNGLPLEAGQYRIHEYYGPKGVGGYIAR